MLSLHDCLILFDAVKKLSDVGVHMTSESMLWAVVLFREASVKFNYSVKH